MTSFLYVYVFKYSFMYCSFMYCFKRGAPRGKKIEQGSIRGGLSRTFRLDLIQKAEPTGSYFENRDGWDFKTWANESFGIFHGDKIFDVKLRFTGEAAKRAERITFHPSQRSERVDKNNLLVYLQCAGHRELIHELCHPDWLGAVVIEEPGELRAEMRNYLEQVLKNL